MVSFLRKNRLKKRTFKVQKNSKKSLLKIPPNPFLACYNKRAKIKVRKFSASGEIMLSKIKEGDVYKVISFSGKTFTLYYGYYDEKDRNSAFAELMPIYPNFNEFPEYTKDGMPFVTQMQDKCEYYEGERNCGEECHDCKHFKQCEELLGVCYHPLRVKKD